MRKRSQRRIRAAAMALVASAAIQQGPLIPQAKAQTLQPVVDVCTGITLPRSAITEVIAAVNAPIVDQACKAMSPDYRAMWPTCRPASAP